MFSQIIHFCVFQARSWERRGGGRSLFQEIKDKSNIIHGLVERIFWDKNISLAKSFSSAPLLKLGASYALGVFTCRIRLDTIVSSFKTTNRLRYYWPVIYVTSYGNKAWEYHYKWNRKTISENFLDIFRTWLLIKNGWTRNLNFKVVVWRNQLGLITFPFTSKTTV